MTTEQQLQQETARADANLKALVDTLECVDFYKQEIEQLKATEKKMQQQLAEKDREYLAAITEQRRITGTWRTQTAGSMSITDKRTGDTFSDFPAYGKHRLGFCDYGYLILTHDKRVLYFHLDYSDDSIQYTDVTQFFEINS